MTNLKIVLLFAICIPFLEINSIEAKQNEFLKEFYEYSKDIHEENAQEGMQDQLPIVVSDITSNHYFDTGKTRIKITKEVKNGMVITTTEKWLTKNSSYLTNMNIAAALSIAIPLTVVGTALVYPSFYQQRLLNLLEWDTSEFKQVNFLDILLQTDKVKKADFLGWYNAAHGGIDKFYSDNILNIPIEYVNRLKNFMDNPKNAANAVKYLETEVYDKDQFIIKFNEKRWYQSRKPEEFKSWLSSNTDNCLKYMSLDDYQHWLEVADVHIKSKNPFYGRE